MFLAMRRLQRPERADEVRPTCRICNVSMWLVRIDRISDDAASEQLHFQCIICHAEGSVDLGDQHGDVLPSGGWPQSGGGARDH
jgi:hypothetical protein